MENALKTRTTPRSKFAFGLSGLGLATAALFTLAYLLTLAEPDVTLRERILITFLGLAFLLLAIFGFAYVQRRGTILAGVVYLFVQFSLTTATTQLRAARAVLRQQTRPRESHNPNASCPLRRAPLGGCLADTRASITRSIGFAR